MTCCRANASPALIRPIPVVMSVPGVTQIDTIPRTSTTAADDLDALSRPEPAGIGDLSAEQPPHQPEGGAPQQRHEYDQCNGEQQFHAGRGADPDQCHAEHPDRLGSGEGHLDRRERGHGWAS